MSRSQVPVLIVAVMAVSFVALAGWLMLNNPTIDGTSGGDNYSCNAHTTPC